MLSYTPIMYGVSRVKPIFCSEAKASVPWASNKLGELVIE